MDDGKYSSNFKPFQVRKPTRQHRQDKPPIKPKLSVTMNVESVLDRLDDLASRFPQTISCWKCDSALALEEHGYSWPIGPYVFFFPGVPGYFCDRCGEATFPNEILDELSQAVDKEVDSRQTAPPFVNPRRISAS